MDSEILNRLIGTLCRRRNNVRGILGQSMTLFKTRDFYEGQEDMLDDIIVALKILRDGEDIDWFLNQYQDYEEE